MNIVNLFSKYRTIEKKNSAVFSFSLALSILACVLTTYFTHEVDSNQAETSFVTEAKPFLVSSFATVITFAITTLSQSLIHVISLKSRNEDVSYFWIIISLGYSIVYTMFYYIYYIKCNPAKTIVMIVATIICIVLSVFVFAEAFSQKNTSLVGDKR